jgi:hypothetical protein
MELVTLGHPSRHPSLGAETALFIFKPKREFQLDVPLLLKARHGDRQQRYGLLGRMIRERPKNKFLGDFSKARGLRNRRTERYGARDRVLNTVKAMF